MSCAKKTVFLLLVLSTLMCLFSQLSGAEKSSRPKNPGDTNAGAVSVSAQAAVLIDANDGSVLYARGAGLRLPMASTAKTMTAVIAIEYGDLNQIIEIPAAAVGVEGSSVYLYCGEKLTLEDLLYAMLLESANDAATAIAIAIAGSVEGFAGLMNAKVAELGLADTHFVNPHGLDSDEQYTTAYDLAQITAYALRNETFAKIVSTKKTTIPLNGTEGVRLLVNHNRLLRSYPGAVGVKTGFTRRSGRCLVSAATRGGLTLIAVTLNAPSDWSDHKKMLDYGFSSYVGITLIEDGEYDLSIPVTGGRPDWVRCVNSEAVRVRLPVGHGPVTCRVEAPRFLFPPVKSGTRVGTIIYYCDGEVVGQSPLVSATSAEMLRRSGFWDWIKSFFGF
ncbi:MAG TPA: D-alanyl-D-alanine carboxypeptidase [Clostridiales bacterium]|nr:D-alanyl-D-alanine carboxypeptidase [Clostridiales bacterium]